ncbi:hypothetical protein DYU11_01600 [Fibrisoma montanum]|uniref:Uncharacterized protein n=1 Tax=Fibrisoma montanum TaxID=2305895 RepID=A0A418MHX5_9BACT|nr:hypothetical protein [Fibrisoma montanum]RIV27038.1 hypothetical protein DYU11_01600 [Fibrisoma montanum]
MKGVIEEIMKDPGPLVWSLVVLPLAVATNLMLVKLLGRYLTKNRKLIIELGVKAQGGKKRVKISVDPKSSTEEVRQEIRKALAEA